MCVRFGDMDHPYKSGYPGRGAALFCLVTAVSPAKAARIALLRSAVGHFLPDQRVIIRAFSGQGPSPKDGCASQPRLSGIGWAIFLRQSDGNTVVRFGSGAGWGQESVAARCQGCFGSGSNNSSYLQYVDRLCLAVKVPVCGAVSACVRLPFRPLHGYSGIGRTPILNRYTQPCGAARGSR